MTTAEIVRKLIEDSGRSQREYAEELGINKVTLCNCLKKDTFSTKMIHRIAAFEKIPYTDLLPDDTEEKIAPSVTGYLEYNGDITKIKDLKGLKKFVEAVEADMSLANIRQIKLPKQQPITLASIDLTKREEYDATKVAVKSFRHGYDIIDDAAYPLGNMCAGFPFELNSIRFFSSEAAYIAGIYSNDLPEHRRLQKKLIEINDGYKAKKEYRHKRYDHIKRRDWEEYNVEWMKYVVWTKCKSNKDFADLLANVPDEVMIVENSTGMKSDTADFWGCFNPELERIRKAKGKLYKQKHPKAKQAEINAEENKWHNFGTWSGVNEMGKILKMCSICLRHDLEMPIDYDLLNNKHIFLIGQELHFVKEKPTDKVKDNKGDKPKYDIRCSDEGYAYFYMDVPLSNWWDSVPAIQYDGHTFNASESLFMYLKAKHFKDEETAAKIVEADNMTYEKPRQRWDAVKKLGKMVKNFDDKKWAGPNRDAMATALKQKALYDEEFKRVLFDPQYAGMTFVEASKYDQIWGIGIDANTAMREGNAGWKGHNFLGKALTDLRNELRPDLEKVQKIG